MDQFKTMEDLREYVKGLVNSMPAPPSQANTPLSIWTIHKATWCKG